MELLPIDLYSIREKQLLDISSQRRVVKDNEQQTTDNKIKESKDILKHSDYKKVAKEMESLFAYQLIKVMRETADSMSSKKKGGGYDTYMSLFDMEVSKLFAERGLGLQDSIIRWLERMPYLINNSGSKLD